MKYLVSINSMYHITQHTHSIMDTKPTPSPNTEHCDLNKEDVLSILQLLEHSEDQSQRTEQFARVGGFIQNMATENAAPRRELEASKRLKEELTNFYKTLLGSQTQKNSSDTTSCVVQPTYQATCSWGGGGQRND